MPGDNCSVVGCGTCRKTKGIGIWKLPAPRNAAYRKWREDWLHELKKYRVMDKNFQRQIDNDKVFTCEKHFHESDIEISKSLCIFLSSFNRASLSTRLVKTCETFDEYQLNFYNTCQQLSYIFSTSCI